MPVKLLRKREQLACVPGTSRPVHQGSVLVKVRNAPEPDCSTLVRNGDHVWQVTRPQTTADRELHTFQQSSGAPLFFEPVDRNRRSAVGRVPAAASLANHHMSDDETLGGQS